MQQFVLPDHDDGLADDRLVEPFNVKTDTQWPGAAIGRADIDKLAQPGIGSGMPGKSPYPELVFECGNTGIPCDVSPLKRAGKAYVHMVIAR